MSDVKQVYQVNGYLFHEKSQAQQAEREVEGVEFVRERNNLDDPRTVLKVYNKIIEQQLFETPVGIEYLRELQSYLLAAPSIDRKLIRPIPVEPPIHEKQDTGKAGKKEKEGLGRFRTSLALNIILILAVIGMFAITMTSQHPTILNYEEQLLNKYAGWEQELDSREQVVKEKEQELNIQP